MNNAQIAVCTLSSRALRHALQNESAQKPICVGNLQTENIGIEHLIRNVLRNPSLRFLIICGIDPQDECGYLPGASLWALWQNGVNSAQEIIEAPGRRPVLKNLSRQEISQFRKQVQVFSLIGCEDLKKINDQINFCSTLVCTELTPFELTRAAPPTLAPPVEDALELDPSGYFVIVLDRIQKTLVLEHYHLTGLLNQRFSSPSAIRLSQKAIHEKLLSRLDHAAYLSRELTRAEHALQSEIEFIQDKAPEAGD